jgi:hypothetical protein
MTLSLAIALNLFADAAIVCGLGYVMSRARRLASHASNPTVAHPALVAVAPPAHWHGPAPSGYNRAPIAA